MSALRLNATSHSPTTQYCRPIEFQLDVKDKGCGIHAHAVSTIHFDCDFRATCAMEAEAVRLEPLFRSGGWADYAVTIQKLTEQEPGRRSKAKRGFGATAMGKTHQQRTETRHGMHIDWGHADRDG